jgi:hypothetical protein
MGHSQDIPNGHQLTSASLVARGLLSPNCVPVKEEVAFAPRKIKAFCAGTSLSDLTLAPKIKRALKLEDVVDFVFYEKNSEVSGIWFEIRYPGVAW